jgi:hypothetical protein
MLHCEDVEGRSRVLFEDNIPSFTRSYIGNLGKSAARIASLRPRYELVTSRYPEAPYQKCRIFMTGRIYLVPGFRY